MRRIVVGTVAALLVFAGGLLASEFKGKIKFIDTGKQAITITTADGQDHVFSVCKDTQFLTAGGKYLKEALKDKHFKTGAYVMVKCEMKQGKEMCTTVQLVQAKQPVK